MTQSQIVKRLNRVERQLKELQQKMEAADQPAKTWRDFVGMFRDDPYFERAVKAGAAYRRSLRPGKTNGKARKKSFCWIPIT